MLPSSQLKMFNSLKSYLHSCITCNEHETCTTYILLNMKHLLSKIRLFSQNAIQIIGTLLSLYLHVGAYTNNTHIYQIGYTYKTKNKAISPTISHLCVKFLNFASISSLTGNPLISVWGCTRSGLNFRYCNTKIETLSTAFYFISKTDMLIFWNSTNFSMSSKQFLCIFLNP